MVVLPLTLLLVNTALYFYCKVLTHVCCSEDSQSVFIDLNRGVKSHLCAVVSLQASRGQKPGTQENIELDYYNLGVPAAEGGPTEEEGAQGAE